MQVGLSAFEDRPDATTAKGHADLVLFDWAAGLPVSRERVLVAGCGSGAGPALLARASGTLTVITGQQAVDADFNRWPELQVECRDPRFPGFEAGTSFDLIAGYGVFEDTELPGLFLWQARSILASGGSLLLSVPADNALTEDGLRQRLADAGWTVVEVQELAEATDGSDRGAGWLVCRCQPAEDAVAEISALQTAVADAIRQIRASDTEMMALRDRVGELDEVRIPAGLRQIALEERLQAQIAREAAAQAELADTLEDNLALRRAQAVASAEADRLRRANSVLGSTLNHANVMLAEQTEHFVAERADLQSALAAIRTALSARERDLQEARKTRATLAADRDDLAAEHRVLAAGIGAPLRGGRIDRSWYDPERPTLAGLVRVAIRRRLYLGTLLRASRNTGRNLVATLAPGRYRR